MLEIVCVCVFLCALSAQNGAQFMAVSLSAIFSSFDTPAFTMPFNLSTLVFLCGAQQYRNFQ